MPKKKHYKKSSRAGQALTEREVEVLWLLAAGHSNKIIGDKLGISPHTAKFHVFNAIDKMGTTCRTKAAVDFVLWQGQAALRRIVPASPKSEYAKYRDEMLDVFAQLDREDRTIDAHEQHAAVA